MFTFSCGLTLESCPAIYRMYVPALSIPLMSDVRSVPSYFSWKSVTLSCGNRTAVVTIAANTAIPTPHFLTEFLIDSSTPSVILIVMIRFVVFRLC